MFNQTKHYLVKNLDRFLLHLSSRNPNRATIKTSDFPRYLRKIGFKFSSLFSNLVFFLYKSDFILHIAPLKKPFRFKENLIRAKAYYPPPGYGYPPGKKENTEDDDYSEYGLFLWPGKLTLWFFFFILLIIPLILLPFFIKDFSFISTYPITFTLVVIVLMMLIFKCLFQWLIPPVLSNVWKQWPKSQYGQFLTVPHKVKLTPKDYFQNKKVNQNKESNNIYWQPDKTTPMRHQSSYYASGMYTLQEVILHLAIFEFFFHNKNSVEGEDESIKTWNWIFYLFSPVWLSYAILLLFLFLYQFKPPSFNMDLATVLQYPFNFAWAGIFWFALSSWFIMTRIKLLKKQEKAVLSGYYETHLELVPQQILNTITQIPDKNQIRDGLVKIQKILHTIQTVGLFTLLMLIEIFSSPYSQPPQPNQASPYQQNEISTNTISNQSSMKP